MRIASAVAVVVMLAACGAMPARAQKPRRASPTLVGNPATAHTDTARAKTRRPSPTLVTPGAAGDSARAPGRAGAASSVAPQSARAAGTAAAFTAGLAIEGYSGESDEARDAYLAQFTQQLDSTIVTLVGVFRGTSGQPVAGADAPTALSSRERDRWARCRDLHYDLQSYAEAMHDFVEELPEVASIQRAGAELDSALTALQATSGCDDVSSMIAAPARWEPWGPQYLATARAFYRDWYRQILDVADRNRALVIAVNATRTTGGRIPVPPGLSRMPPYAGAVPR